jgi:uncharacterized protein (UPF0147 family)
MEHDPSHIVELVHSIIYDVAKESDRPRRSIMSKRATQKHQQTIDEAIQILNGIIKPEAQIPRNIKRAANNAISELQLGKGSFALRASNAISVLEEVSQDPNCPPYARTMILQVLARLETIRD